MTNIALCVICIIKHNNSFCSSWSIFVIYKTEYQETQVRALWHSTWNVLARIYDWNLARSKRCVWIVDQRVSQLHSGKKIILWAHLNVEYCRLLQPSHVGAEDWPGGSWGAGEGQSPRSRTAHGPVSWHMDAGCVTLVHLSLHWHTPNRGEEALGFNGRCEWEFSQWCWSTSFNRGGPCFLYLQTVLRIWDCLFYEGSKVLFRVALTLIIHHQPEILRARSLSDVCECFKQITCGAFTLDCHTFMQVRWARTGNAPRLWLHGSIFPTNYSHFN